MVYVQAFRASNSAHTLKMSDSTLNLRCIVLQQLASHTCTEETSFELSATQAHTPQPYGWRTRLSRITSHHYGNFGTNVRKYNKSFGQMSNILSEAVFTRSALPARRAPAWARASAAPSRRPAQ